ncbi:reverse transcriptase domain-containing protein [Tanacetum coccineum]
MSTREQHTPTIPTSAVRNTGGRNGPQGLEEPTSDEVLRELCDKNYHQLLPLIAEKLQKEKEQQDKLNAVKAHLLYDDESGRNPRNHEESHYSESKTPTARTETRRRHGSKHSRSQSPIASVFRRLKRNRPPSPRPGPRKEGGVFNRLGGKEQSASACSDSRHQSPHAKGTEVQQRKHHHRGTSSRGTSRYSESEDGEGGHWKSKSKRHMSNTYEDDLSQPWTCKERNPFTPRIWHFDFPRTRMPSHVKTYDGSGDLEEHLKLFQSATKTESYEDLRAAFRENYLQQTKHIKDPVEIHYIKQRDGESTEDFMERYKAEVLDVEGAPECMKISGFMHRTTHPELIKRLYEKIQRSMDEMYSVTTSFLQGEVSTFSHSRKKAPTPWRQPEGGNKPNFKKGFKNKQRSDRKPDRELKHNNKPKAPKKGKTAEKDKPLAILMVQSWEMVAKQRVTQSFSSETVISFPPLGEEDGTEGPMIIKAEIGGHFVHRIYVDGGASLEISLLVKIGDEEHSTSAWMNFMVIRSPSQYNRILGRTGIRKIRAIPSTAHEMLKFPIEGGTVTLRSSRVIPMECAMISRPSIQPPVTSQVLEEKIKVAIHPEYPEQTIAIGSTLTEKGRKELCALLRQNLDVFAWKPADMTGVPRHIAEHRLNIREGCLPIRQKKRGQAPERNKAIQEEVEKLVDAGIMKEVHYHSWLSNPVMVKKHDGSWRMCVDFKDLNKACPKDGYPLPEIDWKVESLCGYPFKCFLDAYKGYHQIKMAKEDEEKTTFITSQGIFCYSKMPFGLKNVGATYQRLVDRAFQKQIGRNLEVYVDDLEGMFLGYKVNTDGLKVCPDKADAVLSLPSPGCLKDVQKLNGKLASLNRFLSKSAEKSLPFFKTLKKCTKKSDFQWTQEAEVAFRQMKKLIAELLILTAPKERDELIMYLAAAKKAISAVLMTEREGKQMPGYFPIKQLLSNSEITGRMLKWKFELEGYDIQYRPRMSIKGQILADFIMERPEEESPDELMAEAEELSKP